MSTAALMSKGMEILSRELGNVEAERFFSIIIQEKFDYTKWQREYFDAIPPRELNDKAYTDGKFNG